MNRRRSLTPAEVEKALRSRMTDMEYRTLQSRLTGAVKAIAILREKAPDLVPMMFGESLEQARALPLHTQSALAVLIDELLGAAVTTPTGQIDRKRLLQIVRRVSVHP